jgi:hypothetical protein
MLAYVAQLKENPGRLSGPSIRISLWLPTRARRASRQHLLVLRLFMYASEQTGRGLGPPSADPQHTDIRSPDVPWGLERSAGLVVQRIGETSPAN